MQFWNRRLEIHSSIVYSNTHLISFLFTTCLRFQLVLPVCMMKLMIASPFIASVMMNLEESRLKTFSNWPVNAPVDPKRIAKAGFYYTGQNLEVQCFSCSRRISEWNYNDTVMTLHRELDPVCPFVLSPVHSGNVPITVYNGIQRVLIPDETISVNRISNVDNTSDNDMCDEILRLNTFQNWPISYIVTPESLAKAGLYYIQQDDNVSNIALCLTIA